MQKYFRCYSGPSPIFANALFFVLTAILLLPIVSSADNSGAKVQTAGLRIKGTFIQYHSWMKSMDTAAWQNELDALHRAKFDTLIVKPFPAYSVQKRAVDATNIIVEYADRHGMRIMLGLDSDESVHVQMGDSRAADKITAACMRTADRLWKRYGKHKSFGGWYLSGEILGAPSISSTMRINSLREILQHVRSHCKSLSGVQPFAISLPISTASFIKNAEKDLSSFLKDIGIDILILKDASRLLANAGNSPEILRTIRDACLTQGVQFWSELENFEQESPSKLASSSTASNSIDSQIAFRAPFVQQFVFVDFLQNISPFRGQNQRKRYNDYIHLFVNKAFFPTFGRSVQIDPAFAYYKGRSPASIVSEVRTNGYSVVHYILTSDSTVNPELIDAFHLKGVGVWYATFGNGTYNVHDLPSGWQEWKMVTRSHLEGKLLEDGYARLCLNNPDYRSWKKKQIARMLLANPFQGVDIMESHWPEFPGAESPAYACFCPHCLAAFRRMYPAETAFPDILHAESPRSPQRNPDLWSKWLTFRQKSLTNFLDDIVNGQGGIRALASDKKVCIWTLALSQPGGLRIVRDTSGEDPADMARTVKPDLFCFQTYWPDWIRADLKPDYVRQYAPFVQAVRSAAPELPLMIQADVGSQSQNRRSREWIESFERTCGEMGIENTTFYEFFIRDDLYTVPPKIADAHRSEDLIELTFTSRLDAKSAAEVQHYQIDTGQIVSVTVDGNIVQLHVHGLLSHHPVILTVSGIAADLSKLLFSDHKKAVLDKQTLEIR